MTIYDWVARMTEQESYWIWLSSIDGIGASLFYRILGVFMDAKTACGHYSEIAKRLKLSEKIGQNIRRAASREYWDRLFEKINKSGAKALTRLNGAYPKRLADIDNPPPVLYFRGNLPDDSLLHCAMVGSRTPTRAGSEAARDLAYDLARNGAVIVSGMARGVDAACHIGALDAKGATIAVLGSGVDVIYPEENRGIYQSILERGAVVSEFLPGTEPVPSHFPQRNRIIAGLSDMVVIGEGGERSGARITVDFAQKQGKDVYVMPFDMRLSISKLPMQLLKDGAPVLNSAADIMDNAKTSGPATTVSREERIAAGLDGAERGAYELLLDEELTPDELAQRLGLGIKEINMLITVMELKELIEARAGGCFAAVRRR